VSVETRPGCSDRACMPKMPLAAQTATLFPLHITSLRSVVSRLASCTECCFIENLKFLLWRLKFLSVIQIKCSSFFHGCFYFTINLEKVGVHLYIQNISIQLNAVLFIIYVHPVTNIFFFLTISKLKILSISSFNEISNKDNTG
jgi:hypothetical protein